MPVVLLLRPLMPALLLLSSVDVSGVWTPMSLGVAHEMTVVTYVRIPLDMSIDRLASTWTSHPALLPG
eukprot:6459072-Heterocapsa_arctica.AAC.1